MARSTATRTASSLAFLAALWISSGASGADGCGKSANEVFASAAPSIVKLMVLSVDAFDPDNRIGRSVSTAFLVDRDGTLVSAYHAVMNQRVMTAQTSDGRSLRVDFIAGDPALDIAVLRAFDLSGPGAPAPLEFADGGEIAPGSPLFVMGYPYGLKLSIAAGIASADKVLLSINSVNWSAPYLQTDAAINPGNSGGPVLDACGRVAGVAVRHLAPAEGIGLAIRSDVAASAIRDLLHEGHIVRPWVGIGGTFIDESLEMLFALPITGGFLVETLEPGSDGERAGLRGGVVPLRMGFGPALLLGGDIITRVNGKAIESPADVVAIARSLKPGDDVEFDYFREGEMMSGKITLTLRPVLPDDLRVLYRDAFARSATPGRIEAPQ